MTRQWVLIYHPIYFFKKTYTLEYIHIFGYERFTHKENTKYWLPLRRGVKLRRGEKMGCLLFVLYSFRLFEHSTTRINGSGTNF